MAAWRRRLRPRRMALAMRAFRGMCSKERTKGRWMARIDSSGKSDDKSNAVRFETWTEMDKTDDTGTQKFDEFTDLNYKSLKGYGVVFEDKDRDLKHLVENFTAPALAAAVRDREETLHICAALFDDNRHDELEKILRPFHNTKISERRRKKRKMFLDEGFKPEHIFFIRKYLHRMPRQLPRYAEKRASVLLPLCNAEGVASVLFQYRSDYVRSHKSQVCFPGGIVDNKQDSNIVETCLREMEEEMGIQHIKDVCGILRCDWGTITKLVGVSVTPVVGWMGDIEDYDFSKMNKDEVQAAFTVPIQDLLERDKWVLEEKNGVPTFEFDGGPYRIWGFTAFILYRFLQDVLKKYRVYFDQEVEQLPSEIPYYRGQTLDTIAADHGGKSYGEDD